MSSRDNGVYPKRSSTMALAVLFEYYENCLREDATRCSRSRRPSLPVLQPPPILQKTMSSVGHAKARRPSLVEFHDAMRYHAVDIDGPPYLVAHFPDCGDTTEKIPLEPGLKLYQVFEGKWFFLVCAFGNTCLIECQGISWNGGDALCA
ncbi:unnamed protein product [Haemonchus placei]|uniref:Tudor domain-containing protein n=1 Tax=Haemonchus placei TaxID=6290 RepID=A0A0N4WLS4_HAEPC|nr:unnamed protein product [Haemonchus placei]